MAYPIPPEFNCVTLHTDYQRRLSQIIPIVLHWIIVNRRVVFPVALVYR